MTVYTAILLACAIVSPKLADCQTHEMRFEAGANPVAAVIVAQAMSAEWLAKHPGMKPVRLTIRSGIGA
jgi:hypothetical protein